ncbi:hypothetical protein [Geotalea uraniireducens]|uniref:Cytochrome c domain-containing protein n=1 Tax=Geotalea uraniireducens (strain Rf4) TaxID=351605 RepID=A5G6M4_GEOUR|nr:hypothetical protein [Geotalea uraniireducens]ABQ27442.1 hypothetical protein Gura_3283 [Geotalea uraniireducens Rf4]
MQSRFTIKLVLLLIGAFTLTSAGKAHAIPAFSRQHKTECSTCHTIYPELNEYGDAFQKNSYVPLVKPSEAKAPASPAAAAAIAGEGDPELLDKLKAQAATSKVENDQAQEPKNKGNEGLWLAGIPEQLPLSFRATQNIVYDEHAADGDKFDFSTRTFAFQAGGAFRDKFGFFASYLLTTHADSTTDTNNLHELFLQWRHILDTPINLKFGRFEPKLSLWKKNNKVTTASSLATLSYRVGSSPFTLESSQDALEANVVLWKRLFVAGGIVDRKGQNAKEGYGHVSVKVGGSDLLGNEPAVDLDSDSVWDYLSVTFGTYGYFGRNTINDTDTFTKNRFYRAGGDMDLQYKRLRVKLSGVKGRDDNPDFATVPLERDSVVLASEAEYYLGSPVNAVGLFRYEHQDDGVGIVRRYIPAIAYTPLQNVKVTLEYRYEDAPAVISRITLLGVTYSF